SANVVDAKTKKPLAKPFVVVTVDGVKVGIVGGTSEDTPRTTNSKNLVGLEVRPLAPAIAAAARAAPKAGAPGVIAVVDAGGHGPRAGELTERSPPEGETHCEPGEKCGCEVDAPSFGLARALAANKDGGRVDAIFGGHTHQGVTAVVAGIPVLQAYDNGRA